METKTLISLYDYTGNWSRPYKEAGWEVVQVDIKHGTDIMYWDYTAICADGILVAQPCTCYANCGNRHKKKRLLNGEFEEAQKQVARTKEIIEFNKPWLKFWSLENPRTDIHKKNPWIGKIVQRFNPCDFAGYDPVPDNSRYNKDTWLFGKFNKLKPLRMEPIEKDNPGWKRLGGKSERTKELRSVTPLGFAYAFYEANH